MEPRPDLTAAVLAQLGRFALFAALLFALYRLARPALHRERVAAAFRVLFVALLYAAVATTVLDVFMTRWGFQGDHEGRGLMALLEHRGEKPFVYRVLAPEVVAQVSRRLGPLLSEPTVRWLVDESPLVRHKWRFETWGAKKAIAWHVAYLLLFVSLGVALLAARALVAVLYRAPPVFVDFAPAAALLLLPLSFQRGGYLYDFPELALLFLCALFAVRGRLVAYYVCFVLACLTKESSLLVVSYFVAASIGRMPRARWIAHAGVQLAIGGAIAAALYWVFRDAPGSPAWIGLPGNLLFLISLDTYTSFFDAYGPLIPFPNAFNAIQLFLVGFAVCWRWAEKPREARWMVVLSAAAIGPLYLVFGFLDEIRALGLVFPALFVAGFHTAWDVWGRGTALRESAPPAPPPPPR